MSVLLQGLPVVFLSAACIFNSLSIRSMNRRIAAIEGISIPESKPFRMCQERRKGSAK